VFDVVVAGRVCIDLYPEQVGARLADVTSFSKSIGGSASNVAVANAKLGHTVTLLTRTGDDPFGEYAVRQLADFGVDTQFISPVAGMQSVLTFCEIHPPNDFPLFIWRNPTAPDMYLDERDLPFDEIRDACVFWATATGLSREPSRSAHMAAWAARNRRPNTVLDLDYRPMFWDGPDHAHESIAPALEHVTVAIGNLTECEVAVGEQDPHRAAAALLDRGIELAIVKLGERGVLAQTATEVVEVSPIEVDVVNGLGAGDAFGGALCHGLLNGWPLTGMLQFANAAGAIAASRRECSTAMPYAAEIHQFLDEHNGARHP